MQDKKWIIWGELSACGTNPEWGYWRFDGNAWTLDAKLWEQNCIKIANAGANAVRILPYDVWSPRPHGKINQPSPWQLEDNQWNLDKFNPYYFTLMRKMFEIANERRLTVWFPWFDACQMHKGYWTPFSPWLHNTQGADGFYDTKADAASAKWIKQALYAFGDLDIFWPWGNELEQKPFPQWAQRVLFPLIKQLGIPFDKMTFGATMRGFPYLGGGKFADKPDTLQDTARKLFGAFFGEPNKFKLIREVHECGTVPEDLLCKFGHNPHAAAFMWGNKPVGEWLVSDDGTTELDNVMDGGRPDAERWYDMAYWNLLNFRNVAGFEHLGEGGDLDYQVTIFDAISDAYAKRFGTDPYNRKHPQVHEEPVPPEPPVPDPLPPIVLSCADRYIKHRPMKKWQVWKYILCKLGL